MLRGYRGDYLYLFEAENKRVSLPPASPGHDVKLPETLIGGS